MHSTKMYDRIMTPLLRFFVVALFMTAAYQSHASQTTGFVTQAVKTGEHVISIMRKYGFEQAEREAVLRLDPGLAGLTLTLDSIYLVSQSKPEVALRFYDERRTNSWTVTKTPTGEVQVKKAQPRFRVDQESFSGSVRGSLFQAINRQTGSNWVASRFLDAYQLQMDLNRIPRGSQFRLTVEKMYDGEAFVGFGEVVETFLDTAGQSLRKIFVRDGDEDGGIFFAREDLDNDRPLYSPVNYVRVSSHFQPRRRHPITRRLQPHNGIDFELEEGAPILAPREGVVLRTGRQKASGLFVVVAHDGGYETSYNHLSNIDESITAGSPVKAGQRLGAAGCTGYCTKTHLHFAVRKNGRWVDPAKHLKPFPATYEKLLLTKLDHARAED